MILKLNSVPESVEQFNNLRNLFQSIYLPIPEPATITSSLQSALFVHYHQDCNAGGLRVRFGLRLLNLFMQTFSSQFVTISEIDLNFNVMARIYQRLTFLINYDISNSL